MKTIEEFYKTIEVDENREKFKKLMERIQEKYPDMNLEIKWSQPMFVMEGTFIIGFSVAKKHFSLAPEHKGLEYVEEELREKKMDYGKQIIRFPWDKEIDYDLIYRVIDFNREDKKGSKKFWR